ncbi:MAG: histidine phosphatase family protein, partial [Planctomycetes bacterium]|nr:histidine phosphatase family protein [Planctomycetota bacterium]
MDIYLLRHGLSLGNLKGFYESFADDALCDEGIEQAQKFSDSIKNASFDRICSSSMRRAMQSILPYLQANSLHAELWPEMEEACYQTEREAASSDWRKQPLPMDESLDQYFTLHGEAQHRVDDETFAECMCRVECVYRDIICAHKEDDSHTLLVAHEHFIRELMNLMLKTEDLQAFQHD